MIEDPSLPTLQKLKKMLAIQPRWFILSDIRVLKELKQRYPRQWADIDEHVTLGWARVRQVVKEGIQEGAIRPFDMDLFIQVYIGGLYRLLDGKDGRRDGLTMEQALVQMVELLLYGIAIQKETRQ
ncbi:hypothetical protein [Marinicrinis lubricantis]|uniref:Uncharacterized protein n=1 Tax=Marinicrinis lubricantis TaxID=2086470 RepID=A0ABW1IHD5_9BACL